MSNKSRAGNGHTVFDVAQYAGVSIATVSRALSGNRPVSDELRRRVESAAEELGYQVNLVGRALRQKKTSSVGLIIPDLENPFFSSLAQRISRRFRVSQVDVLVASADNDQTQELRAVQSFLGRQVDALVMIPTDEADSFDALKLASESVPTIQFDRRVPDSPVPFIGVHNVAGMGLIHDYIRQNIDIVRQPIILVGGGDSSSSGRERSAAFASAGDLNEQLEGSFSFQWGQEAAQQILRLGYKRATIVAAADVIALGAMSWLLSSGYQIPEAFRIIGFDDVGVSYLSHPALTTVQQPLEEMSRAVEAAIYANGGNQSTDSEYFRPKLINRQSG